MQQQNVQLQVFDQQVVMDNGIISVTISKPQGMVTAIGYSNMENILEPTSRESNSGYWDLNWSPAGSSGTRGTFQLIQGSDFRVVTETDDQIELSFSMTWDVSSETKLVPLNIDKRFVLLRGCSGFYSYAIYEHLQEWPGFNLNEARIVFRLQKDKFNYMVVADNRQRFMPLPEDRMEGRGQPLDYPEAVLLVDPVEPEFKGEVDDKYQYSGDNDEVKVHGWISNVSPSIGFWQIMPSNEFRTGGPSKQDLTSHVGPYTLAMFVSAHYGGEDLVLKFEQGEPWKKVFGPVFMYLNSGDDRSTLWEDAKNQATKEADSWPYGFPESEDFPTWDLRGALEGKLLVRDRWENDDDMEAKGAYIGLAPPGAAGSWQTEGKGYQFWTRTDEGGNFSINNIRSGIYNLYAWIPGYIGDYMLEESISIAPGSYIYVDELVYEPPRDGPMIWEIGFPDRSAQEFYVPDPNPKYINKLYINHPQRFRQYGLWERYAELYPDNDLVYTIGESDFAKDWFFAHVTRKIDEKTYRATTWQIRFKLDEIKSGGNYKLRIAIASANQAELQIRVNDAAQNPPLFTTGLFGKDNAIARHGIHGLQHLFTVELHPDSLLQGPNTLYFTQANATTPFQGIMYDYIRLEAP